MSNVARGLTPGQVEDLRPHVVNLSLGKFSDDGTMTTDSTDVDAIFDVHLPAFLQRATKPAPLVIWAHGGLVSEDTGLTIASNQVPWWLSNGAYPLHFVWESGFFDALKQVLSGRVARDLADHTIDPAIEFLARPLGSKMWTAMKTSAELASVSDGGARYVARRLAKFCADHPGQISLHAAGHSAGAIFQSWFLPAARDEGVPAFDSLHLLAPALRVDSFLSRLLPEVNKAAGKLTIYTMNKQTERDDNVSQIYRKSLLYLVSRAFEGTPEVPILGLEESIRQEPALVNLLGLNPQAAGGASVIWSPTRGNPPLDSRSGSRSHGGFDNDVDTMNSIARRILGRDNIVEFPAGTRSSARELGAPIGAAEFATTGLFAPAGGPTATVPTRQSFPATGKRVALCVGVDAYPPPHQLGGCVADMREWAGYLGGLGFEVTTLTDNQATREDILRALRSLISSSSAGDILAFQYSGHGTQVPDLDGDEGDVGFNSDADEAICPVDFGSGKLIIDDELRAVFATLPVGVSLTTFFDCCHSGTNNRALDPFGNSQSPAPRRNARYVVATPDLIDKHRKFRATQPPGVRRSVVTAEQMRNVSVAACQDYEVAYESNGHGHFTTRAMQVLRQDGAGLTNRGFAERVTALFGQVPDQQPKLDCSSALEGQPLLAGVLSPAGSGVIGPAGPTSSFTVPARSASNNGAAVAELLRALAAVLDHGTS